MKQKFNFIKEGKNKIIEITEKLLPITFIEGGNAYGLQ